MTIKTRNIADDAVTADKIADGAVDSAQIATGGVDKTHLSGGFLKTAVVAGQDETMDTTITVTGIAVGDEVVSVLVFDPGDGMGASIAVTQRAAADFTVTANTLTIGANAADNTGNTYIVFYLDLT